MPITIRTAPRPVAIEEIESRRVTTRVWVDGYQTLNAGTAGIINRNENVDGTAIVTTFVNQIGITDAFGVDEALFVSRVDSPVNEPAHKGTLRREGNRCKAILDNPGNSSAFTLNWEARAEDYPVRIWYRCAYPLYDVPEGVDLGGILAIQPFTTDEITVAGSDQTAQEVLNEKIPSIPIGAEQKITNIRYNPATGRLVITKEA